METKIFVFDPLFPKIGISHHNSVKDFIETIEPTYIAYAGDQYFAALKPKSRFFNKSHKFQIGLYLISKSITFCIIHRKTICGKTIFFPHSDLVSTTIFLVARKLKLIDVKFTIRMIGIRDYSTLGKIKSRFISYFLNFVLRSDDKLAAETKALIRKALMIQKKIRSVEHTPYPGFINLVKGINPISSEHMLFIGNPREDKGYFEVLKLAKDLPNIKLRIQLPNKEDSIFQDALRQTRLLSNVEFFDTPLTEEDMIFEIARSRGLLMPYSESLFADRGSGILTAGILTNKTIFGLDQTSFKEECEGFTVFREWKELRKLSNSNSLRSESSSGDYREYVNNNWKRLLS